MQTASINSVFGLDDLQVWDTELAFLRLQSVGKAESKRTAERRLHETGLLPPELSEDKLLDELGREPNTVVRWREGRTAA